MLMRARKRARKKEREKSVKKCSRMLAASALGIKNSMRKLYTFSPVLLLFSSAAATVAAANFAKAQDKLIYQLPYLW